MSRIRNLSRALTVGSVLGASALGGVAAFGVAPAGATILPIPPHITATPADPMINTKTILVGTGFAPNATLTVEECSRTSWIAPQDPCATSNVIRVHTSPTGHFRHALTAEICPGVGPGVTPPGFVQLCWVGVPTPVGVDGITLVGASRLTVTGP